MYLLFIAVVVVVQGTGPYTDKVKEVEDDIAATMKRVNELAGIKESDTGLAVPALWDIQADKQALQTEEPLQVHTGMHACHCGVTGKGWYDWYRVVW